MTLVALSASYGAGGSVSSEDFQRATGEVLVAQAQTGDGVILGRGAVALLRDRADVLHVPLHGPVEARVRQAMQLDRSLDVDRAERTLRQFDRTHAAYLQQLYDVDIGECELYHLVLDSTAIELDTCADVIGAGGAIADRSRCGFYERPSVDDPLAQDEARRTMSL